MAGNPEQEFYPEVYSVILTEHPRFVWRGLPPSKELFDNSPYQVRIKAEYNTFGVIYSDYATLRISSPCFDTVIENQILNDMRYEIGT